MFIIADATRVMAMDMWYAGYVWGRRNLSGSFSLRSRGEKLNSIFLLTEYETLLYPLCVIGKPPHVTGKPPHVTGKPPHVTGKPPHVTGEPLRVTSEPLRVISKPLRVILEHSVRELAC